MTKIRALTTARCLTFAAIGLLASPASAVLIDNGMTTTDTDQNLLWLDLTSSQGRSFDDVSSHFGVGGDFQGWRHATISEVTTLFTNAGFAPPYDGAASAPMLSLIDLLGRTFSQSIADGGTFSAQGLFDDGNALDGVGGATLRYSFYTAPPGSNSDRSRVILNSDASDWTSAA